MKKKMMMMKMIKMKMMMKKMMMIGTGDDEESTILGCVLALEHFCRSEEQWMEDRIEISAARSAGVKAACR